LGMRPTVDGLHHRFETHLLDFPPPGLDGDLYGQSLSVDFVARLRDEQRFADLKALVAQIHVDIAEARKSLRNAPVLDAAPLLVERTG
ncbi:MAG: riboflavin kinase, partial [Chloroflexota bacterium]|nr:riboflavin kinase [Chloroflexota bacterium]